MTKTKILVVEDEGIVALSIQRKLINFGYDVPVVATSGEEAIIASKKIQPHLILMDIMLEGDMDGIEATTQIQTMFDIPIIYLTANSDEQTLQRAKQTHPLGYLLKPFEDRELYATVEIGLSKHQLDRQVKENEQWLATTLKSIGDGVITTDQAGSITFMNPTAEQLTGWSLVEAIGQPLPTIFEVFKEDKVTPIENPVVQTRQQGHVLEQINTYILINKNNAKTIIEYNAALIKGDARQVAGVVLAFRDVSQRKQAEQKLEEYRDHLEELVTERTAELAKANNGLQQEILRRQQLEDQMLYETLYDKLTGLPNQALLKDHIQRAIRQTQQNPNHLFALLLLNLDKFQRINDSLGYAVGDRLLMNIANRLTTLLRPGDLVARLGGDEFVIMINDIQNKTEALTYATKINDAIGQPLTLGEQDFIISATIGIALSKEPTSGQIYTQFTNLLRDADIALSQAKDRGRNQAIIFDSSMHARTVALVELEAELRLAFARDQFQVFYQPIISLTTAQIVGFEALLRWQHPQKGFIPPAKFIPVLEDLRLILSIGEWVLDQVCHQLKIWHAIGYSHLRAAVNLSVHQLGEPTLLATLQTLLTETDLAAQSLELEVTESVAMQHADGSLKALKRIHNIGINLSVDDFGTGYSSLARLKQMPVNTLKIDRSFVRDIPEDRDDIAIIKAIIALGHALNLKVLAEGVETDQQLNLLQNLGCDEAQGYLFSRAVPAQEMTKLLAKDKRY